MDERMKRVLLIMLCMTPSLAGLAAEIRDPMRPPQRSSAHRGVAAGVPVVSALFIGATRRAAIVDGRLVHEGDTLGAGTIVALLDDGIRYQSGGVLHELHLLASDLHFKKPAATVARLANGGS
jgi:hypothetical protein